MLTFFRWLLRFTILLIVCLVVSTFLIRYFALRSVPAYDTEIAMSEISAPIEITRTTQNVPHIFADNDSDAYFALGVSHAQDRLFQMTMLRRAAQGRLAEIYGPSAIKSDDLALRLGLADRARESVNTLSEDAQMRLQSYASGVNAWITHANAEALGRGAPEFFLSSDEIAFWKPADSLAILKLLAAASSTAIEEEVMRARLSLANPEFGPEFMTAPAPSSLPAYADLFPNARVLPPEPDAHNDWDVSIMGFLSPGIGYTGNLIAVTPDRTAAGGALLAADQQSALTAPGLFYLARLELETGAAIGATIPGLPVILSGRNPHLAWGLTPAGNDDADLLVEEIQPGNSDRYRGQRGWQDFDTRRVGIAIRDAEPQVVTLRNSANGPLLSALDFDLGDVMPVGHAAALQWTGLSSEDRSIEALMGLMHAQRSAEIEETLKLMTAPMVQVAVADMESVSLYAAGAEPQRDSNHETKGTMPAPGWNPANRWTGTAQISLSSNLAAQNGVVTASGESHAGQALRLLRLRRLIEDREIHSRDSLIAAQLDTVSPAARALLPIIGADLWYTGDAAPIGTQLSRREEALALLAEWDGNMNEHLPEPLIYAAWMAALQKRLIADELGPTAEMLDRINPQFLDAVFRNRNGMARWCDVVQSAPVEDCTTIIRQALDEAIIDLTDTFGSNVTSWRWGDLHQAIHEHPSLGDRSGLNWIVNIVQSVSGGDYTMARAALKGSSPDPYRAVIGAGYRGVYDLADPDSSVFVISTGQSGHPLSRHYDDLADFWRRGEYISMSLDPDLARAASRGTTILRPTD